MLLILTAICLAAICLAAICLAALCLALLWIKRERNRREMELHSIAPEALYALMISNRDVLVFDVRVPLDLLADSEIISGAQRVAPQEILDNPSILPRERDLVVYCTCPSDKTSRAVTVRARAMGFSRVKVLKGGLAAWKAKGYPVERYDKPFHLDTGS